MRIKRICLHFCVVTFVYCVAGGIGCKRQRQGQRGFGHVFKKGNNAVGYTPIRTRAIWVVLGAAVVIAGVALTVHLRQRRDVAPLPTPKALQIGRAHV